MAQHPHPPSHPPVTTHPAPGGVEVAALRSQSPPSAPTRPAPLSLSDLYVRGERNLSVNPFLGEQVGQLAGITSGQGNQGSAGGWFAGQAGTYGDARGQPRNLKQGTSLTGFV